jgi:hypothetical protein
MVADLADWNVFVPFHYVLIAVGVF